MIRLLFKNRRFSMKVITPVLFIHFLRVEAQAQHYFLELIVCQKNICATFKNLFHAIT